MEQSIEKTLYQPYVFFDQNVMEKVSKKRYEPFQDNVNKIMSETNSDPKQRLTLFGLLEFVGLKKSEIFFNIDKDKKLNNYQLSSYTEVEGFIPVLEEKIREKISNKWLKEKLEEKRQRDFFHFNKHGLLSVNKYIYIIDSIYENLIYNLLLDRISKINTSNFSLEDKRNFIHLLTKIVISNICQKQILGSFRLVCKLMNEIKKEQKLSGELNKKYKFFNTVKTITAITEELKSAGDLMDCELIHLVFFGTDGNYCHCYTTDKEEQIMGRLHLYYRHIHFLIWLFFDYSKLNGNFIKEQYTRPEWRCGKVFILNRDTGEKVKEISTTEIYEKSCSEQDS